MRLLLVYGAILAGALCAVAVPPALAQRCANGRCSPVATQDVAPQSVWHWVQVDGDDYALYRSGVHVGTWSMGRGVFAGTDGGQDCPAPIPDCLRAKERVIGAYQPPTTEAMGPPQEIPHWQVQGVDMSKVGDQKYTREGHPISRPKAFEVVSESKIPDDGSSAYLVLVGGTDGQRNRILEDVKTHTKLASATAKMILRSYPADHHQVKRCGYDTDGKPAIYWTDAKGKLLGVWKSYQGADWLADRLAGKPDVEPAPPIPGGGFWPWINSIPPPVLIVGAVLGMILLFSIWTRKATPQ